MHIFQLSIVTPEKAIFEGTVYSLIARGTLGYLEILAHHAPLITTLEVGKVTVVQDKDTILNYTISGGFLEVSNNRATVLADSIEIVSPAIE